MEQKYERIEAYLDGTLPEAERKAFEAEIAKDAEIAKEIKLHRRLQSTLGNEAEWQFRQNLEAISDGYQAPDKNKNPGKQGTLRLFLGILTLSILASLLYFFFMPGPDTPPAERPEIEQPAPSPTAPEEAPADEPEVQETTPAPTTPEAPPIAAIPSDQPNAALEALVTASPLSTAYELAVEADLSDPGFALEGEMLSAQYKADQIMTITLFDNQPGSYPDAPLHTGELQVMEIDEDAPLAFAAKKAYFLAYEAELDLPAGLYYYVIRTEGEAEALWVGKVEQ
jgi:hypothetical protein